MKSFTVQSISCHIITLSDKLLALTDVALHVRRSEWWAGLSLTGVMACEQPSGVWIGGLLDGVPTQTASAGLGGTVGQLPSAAAILHAVHTAQSHTLN